MSVILLPNQSRKQPQITPKIDRRGIGKNIKFALLGNYSNEIVSNVNRSGSIGQSVNTFDGIGYQATSSETSWFKNIRGFDPKVGTGDSFSVNWYGTLQSDSNYLLLGCEDGYGWRFVTQGWSPTQLRIGIFASWFGGGPLALASITDGKLYSASLVYDGETDIIEIFLNGTLLGSATFGGDNSQIQGNQRWGIANNPSKPHTMLTVQAYSGKLSYPEIRSLAENPWQVFKAPPRRFSTETASGPSFFDTDFSYSGSSNFTSQESSIFSIYYNFNNIGVFTPNSIKIDNSDLQSESLTTTAINDSIIVGTKTDISGSSISNIQSQKIVSVNYTTDGTCVVTYQVGPELIISTFAQDSFSGTPGQEVTTYNPDWYRSSWGFADQKLIISDEQRTFAIGNAPSTPVFFHRNIPATADYDVSADIHIKTATETVGLIGRADDTVRNHYLVQFTSAFVKLFRVINWATGTLLQQKSITLNVGQTYNLKLSMFGDIIKVYIDGVEQLSTTDAAPITAKGSAGIRYYFDNTLTNSTGMHIDNFLAQNTNTSNKNIISINIFPAGTSVSDPKIQSIISQNLSSEGTSSSDINQTTIENTEVNSVNFTTADFIDSIITSSEVSSNGLSISNISNIIIKPTNTNISSSSIGSFTDTIINNNSFDIDGISGTDIKSAYAYLCELVANSVSTESLISSIVQSTEINSVGSCVITFYEGTDGGTTFINVDFIISGSSTTLPTIQKVISSNLSTEGTSLINVKDQIIKLSDISSVGSSQTSIINNIIINSRIISDGVAGSTINAVSIQNTDLESIGSSITNFLDNFVQSTDFLSNGTYIVTINTGADGGTVYINVDFIINGTSTINNTTGTVLNADINSQSTADFISNFTKISGQDFSSDSSVLINFIREYLILQSNRRYISMVERRNYISRVEHRNYTSKVKGNG